MPLTANQIKFIHSLKLKKNRSAHRLFIAEGEKIVRELLGSTFRIRNIYATQPESFAAENATIERVSEKELSRISALSTSNKVLAVVEMPSLNFDSSTALTELVLAVESINDPGNLGTLIRIADWFGIRHIICSPDTVEVYNPKTIQASMGSIARVQLHYLDLPSLFSSYKSGEAPVYGALLEGASIYESKKGDSGFLLFGSESHGISDELLPHITQKLMIPRIGGAESLNVAVAAGIFCAEFRRGN